MLTRRRATRREAASRNLPLAVSVDEIALDRIDARCREEVLSPSAVAFLEEIHLRFEQRRRELLEARRQRDAALRDGATLDFLSETREVREAAWRVAPPREDYIDRRVEITGPTDRKLVINALNSGARGFMADFEDASSPTWHNQVSGQATLIDAIDGTISYTGQDGRAYQLGAQTATLIVRPRGWHLEERHLRVGDEPIAGALFDFGLFAFHCAARLHGRGRGVYLYLPKLEHHREARLWDDVLAWSEERLGLPHGLMRATVLIETLPAAFQMDEILHELRDHSYGLNAGRWDYIFSTIKTFRDRPEFVLPDRGDVTMRVPFMAAYTELLVQTCHRRGAFAMGGMAALIPSREDPQATARAIAAVRADKEREAQMGFDGTWIAHPDVLEAAQAPFNAVLGSQPNQIGREAREKRIDAAALLDIAATPGALTEAGLRANVSVAFRYISFWLGGRGAAAIDNLMEDAATAEICRSQIWQWIRHRARLDDGRSVSAELVRQILDEETERIRADVGEEVWAAGRPDETRRVFERISLQADLPEFMTEVAYDLLD
jgi:malate synthase